MTTGEKSGSGKNGSCSNFVNKFRFSFVLLWERSNMAAAFELLVRAGDVTRSVSFDLGSRLHSWLFLLL